MIADFIGGAVDVEYGLWWRYSEETGCLEDRVVYCEKLG
jgi:hypothetical protein